MELGIPYLRPKDAHKNVDNPWKTCDNPSSLDWIHSTSWRFCLTVLWAHGSFSVASIKLDLSAWLLRPTETYRDSLIFTCVMLISDVSKPTSASCINAWQQAQEMVWCTSKGFSCQWVKDAPSGATWCNVKFMRLACHREMMRTVCTSENKEHTQQ